MNEETTYRQKGRTANIGLVQCGAKCFVSAFVRNQTFVLHMYGSTKNPALHQAVNR